MSRHSNQNKNQIPKQYGGAASGWRHSSMARYVQPGAITRLTLQDIDRSPMFNPLEYNTKIPMGYVSTGIIPEGIYYMNQAAKQHCKQLKGCQEPARVLRQTKSGRESLIEELKRSMN
tara:strand:+ start:1540 stop:1893 length:354 start_codon:yes stop_codon:yes gene_type:complete